MTTPLDILPHGSSIDLAALRSAELSLLDHLTHRLRVGWAQAVTSVQDRENGDPTILVYASDIEPARRWVESQDGEWRGWRLVAVPVGGREQ